MERILENVNIAWSAHKFHEAFCFAAKAHNGQLLPGTDLPYLTHIALVCAEVMVTAPTASDPDVLVQCAALHDSIEDTDVTYDALLQRFGKGVADGVRALTKNRSIEKATQVDESLGRIRLQPKEIWMVKMADRITNLYPPPATWSREKRTSYREESGRILAMLGDANAYLAQRLANRITEYESYI
jgi:(p)ppGpp synthase/HD superfamily hydrolase